MDKKIKPLNSRGFLCKKPNVKNPVINSSNGHHDVTWF